ncbi:membrane integrity-associated transporter subunit PqiC [Pseudomonas sp. R5(2019)]|uniref:PqiC family protein n=1 Tax=Pseudomonas sp. R5(2019) TaxID=2697566 RepID=UPI003531E043
MSLNLRALALFGTLGLAACTSAPTHYYTLVATAPDNTPRTNVTTPAFQFEMQPVRVPVQADQPQVVIRHSNGILALMETDRWSAPLADEFHDALAAQMELKLGTRDLAGFPKVAGIPLLALQTDVRRFDSVQGQYALIDVLWSLRLRGDGVKNRSLTCSNVIRQPAGGQVQELVVAHQQAIAQLAGIIASTASNWSKQSGTGCPQG